MNRYLSSIALLAAFLVGCATSAMRLAPPAPVSAASRAHPLVVTGPCYKHNSNDCATTYHFVHDTASISLDNDCTTGSGCPFSTNITFSGTSAPFANTNYQCHAIGTDSNHDGVVWNTYPVDGSDVNFAFRNETGHTITAGTTFNISY